MFVDRDKNVCESATATKIAKAKENGAFAMDYVACRALNLVITRYVMKIGIMMKVRDRNTRCFSIINCDLPARRGVCGENRDFRGWVVD